MDGTFGGGDLISASLAIMLGGTDAELHDKEVTLTTSDVTGSQTAVFEYDPQDEPTTGTPPGPWDGYSLFTVDLSGVKDDIEDLQQQVSDLEDELEDCHDCRDAVVAAIQVYDPTYDPQPDECPADEIPTLVQAVQPILGSKFITANGTYLPASDNLDGYNQVVVDVPTWESCIQTIAAKLGVQEPYDCQDITDAIDEHDGYVFPEDTDIDNIIPIIAPQDPVEIDGNDYYFVYNSRLSLDHGQTYTDYNVFSLVQNVATSPSDATFWCRAYIYRKSDNVLVDSMVLLPGDGGNIGIGGYFQITGLRIDYTNKTLISDYRSRIWPNDAGEVTGTIVNNISAYLTTQSPNPQYKVRNS